MDFVAGFFSSFLLGKKVPRKILQENPQNPPKFLQQNPRHVSAEGAGQVVIYYYGRFGFFFSGRKGEGGVRGAGRGGGVPGSVFIENPIRGGCPGGGGA